ncbi:MAG: VIT1/CCC1 transporter family protein [Promethearchaeota archaeon]
MMPREEEHIKGGGKIRSIILGLNDGLISTFTLLAGVAAATIEATGGVSIVILTGIAAMVSGAISMGLGEYISSKSEFKYIQNEIKKEKAEIELFPEEEKEEVKEIFRQMHINGEVLDACVESITSDKDTWVEFLLRNELGLEEPERPLIGALLTFFSFILGAFIPLAPYFLNLGFVSMIISAIISFSMLTIVGGIKTKITGESILKGALEMLIIGIIAFIASFTIGTYLEPDI